MTMKSKKYAVTDQPRCVACGECASVCRIGAIKIIDGCYAYANPETCVGCGLCSKSCPVGCISLKSREEADRNEKEMV